MKKFLAFLLLLLPVSAFAHAFPVAYSPDGFSLNPTMPSEVTIRFSQGISPIGNGIEVFAPDGTKLPGVEATVDVHDAHMLSRSLIIGKGDGIYVVSWHGVSSEDGHFTKGAFSFFVGATSSAPYFYGGGVDTEVGASRATELSRLNLDKNDEEAIVVFLFFLALSILMGAFVFSFLLRREKTLNDRIRVQLVAHLHLFAYLALLLLFTGVAAIIILKVQFPFTKPSGIFAIVSLFTECIAVIAASLWVGGMLTSAFVLLPLIASSRPLLSLRAPLRMLSGRIFVCTLFLFCVSGAWSVWVHLKGWDNLTTTVWGSTLITLLLFLAVLLVLRSTALVFLERMKRCIHCECAYALLELGVGLCVVFYVALLSVTPSPIYHMPLWHVTRMDSSRMITVTDLGSKENILRFRASDVKGAPIVQSLPTVLLDNAKEGIGPLVIPVKDRGEGNYDIPLALLTPEGEWRIAITFKQQGAYDINATIGIDYPREIRVARTNASTPRFGSFEALLFSVALMSSVLAFVLLLFVKRNTALALLHSEYDTDPASIGAGKAIVVAFAAFLSVLVLVVMLRIMFPFYSEKISDGKIISARASVAQGMSGMQM